MQLAEGALVGKFGVAFTSIYSRIASQQMASFWDLTGGNVAEISAKLHAPGPVTATATATAVWSTS